MRFHLGKYPICDQYYDSFKYWLQNNLFNISSGAIESGLESMAGVLQIGVGASTGDVSGVASGVGRTAGIFGYAWNLQKELYMKKRIPPSSISNSANGNVISALKENVFSFYQMSIKREYARLIDNFFSKFGYKVLSEKIPNITRKKQLELCKNN